MNGNDAKFFGYPALKAQKAQKVLPKRLGFLAGQFWELFLNPNDLVGFILGRPGFADLKKSSIKKVGFILGRPGFADLKKSSIKKVGFILGLETNFLKLI